MDNDFKYSVTDSELDIISELVKSVNFENDEDMTIFVKSCLDMLELEKWNSDTIFDTFIRLYHLEII